MTDQQILDRLWQEYRETPFASFGLQRKLDLPSEELKDILCILSDMSDSGEIRNGYIVKRVASTIYKLRQHTQHEPDSMKVKQNDGLTGEIRGGFSDKGAENDHLERFSFFARGDQSKESKHTGDIKQLHQKLTTDPGWKLKIEKLRSLTGEAQAKAKAKLPAFTPSICLSSGKRTGDFVHTNLIQADFDEALDFDKLFDDLCIDPHARLIFRSPRGKVKALIKVSPAATVNDHAAAFEAVRSYCQAQGYGEIDGKPKNINCLCFISHDPSAVIKDAKPLHWDPLPSPTAQTHALTDYDGEIVELTDWLKAYGVTIHDTRDHNGNLMYLVDCPWENEHTQDFGHKDTAVFVDATDNKWCFNCFHAHCEHRGWEDYRAKVAPKETHRSPHQHNYSPARARLNRTKRLYGGNR